MKLAIMGGTPQLETPLERLLTEPDDNSIAMGFGQARKQP